MPTLLAVLFSLCGCRTHPSAEAAVEGNRATTPVTTSAPQPTGGGVPTPTDPFAPFAVASQLDISLPNHLFAGGFKVRGSVAAPVNTEEADRDFFTDPAFDKEGNSGRLFSSTTTLYNEYEPKKPERSVAFICWKPVVSGSNPDSDADKDNGSMMAQQLPARDGYSVYEVTTDGKHLFVRFEPAYGTKSAGKPRDVYVWKGNALGKGRFVPKDNKPFPPLATVLAKDYEAERERGFEALTARKPDEAIEAFEKAIKRKPDDGASFYGLGLALERSSHLVEAEKSPKIIAAFSRAVEIDGQRTEAWRARGALYGAEKKYEKAIADATKVIALEPKEAGGYIERAQYYSASGAHGKAVTDVQAATRLKPEEREYWEILTAEQYHTGRYDEAIKSAHRALDQDDSRNRARLVLAYIYARREQTDKALKQIQEAHDNGVTYDERRNGLREIKKALGVQPKSAALQAIYHALSGTDHLEPDEE